ncbi:MAG: Do family serine endopeptidase [Bacteroidales bacterium]
MKQFKNILLVATVSILSVIICLIVYTKYFLPQPERLVQEEVTSPFQFTSVSSTSDVLPDLTFAAEKSIHAVVHITSSIEVQGRQQYGNPLYEFFYGDRYQQQPRTQEATGSGVIISKDGYIATNNHVIEDAENIKVVLNDKREYKAELVGTDPNTDIALLKIDEKELPFLTFKNSNDLKLGEWVLAVGNPYNLTSTVTAGIVSAKARNIGIIGSNSSSGQMPIEAFIQTDAAVNPGNSGGALVNMSGDLVGINTAIASRTGSYTGYSFAVPSTIVKKVVDDLKQYGTVQRAMLGVGIANLDGELAKKHNIKSTKGVYVTGVVEGMAADKAGIEESDVILEIDGKTTNSVGQLQEAIGQHRPGDKVGVKILRDNKEQNKTIELMNEHGNTDAVKNTLEIYGAVLQNISYDEKSKLGISHGVMVSEVNAGKLKEEGVRKGFIITHVNKEPISNVNDLLSVVDSANGVVLLEGIYENRRIAYYAFTKS